MQKLNPRLEELRRQYGTDKKRLQEETMKLYQEEKVNPAGGCLPMLIQFPIILSLYPVITRPLRYMLGKTQEQIVAITELFNTLTENTRSFVQEMEVINYFRNNNSAMAQAESANLLVQTDLINMNFFGLDLSRTPTYSPEVLFGEQMAIYLPLLLIPLIGVLSTYISGRISMASTAAQSAQNQQASSMNKSMQVIGPVMTLIFSFQLPAGVLVYWIAGYLIQIVQQLFINKYILKLGNIFTGKSADSDASAQRRLPDKGGGGASVKGDAGVAIGTAGGLASNVAGGSAGSGGGSGGSGGSGSRGSGGGSGSGGSSGKSGANNANGANISNIVQDAAYNNSGTAGSGAVSSVRSISSNEQSEGDLYDGGAMINKVISTLDMAGATGSGVVKSAGADGIVHGGVFESKYRIPGITSTEGYYQDDPETDDGIGDYAGWEAGDEISNYGGQEAGDGTGDNSTIESGQRQRGVDTRSSTRKNYGSQKRKKKK